MPPKAGYSTPMLHVADVARSLRFYQLLGFETIDTDATDTTEGDPSRPGWARMHCEGGALMFLGPEDDEPAPAHPPRRMPDRFLLAMYTPDLPALREHLLAQGVEVPAITYPEWMPSGQVHIKDPDGYRVNVNHWGKKEHEEWEKRLSAKKSSSGQT